MNSTQLLFQIQKIIDELSSINSRLIDNNETLSAIEKELLRSKCIQLFDFISKLSINDLAIEKKSEMKKDESVSMEEFEIKEAIQISNVHSAPLNKEELFDEEKIISEHTKDASLFTETIKDPLISIHHSEISLHEKISGSKQTDLKGKINDSKVESLKSVINLNKKIAFVNDLFKENTVEYAKAIEKLNTSTDLNEAMHYFNELKHDYNWENSNELVSELEQLIQKRYR